MGFALGDLRRLVSNDVKVGIVIDVTGDTVTVATEKGRQIAKKSSPNILIGSRVSLNNGVAKLALVPEITYYV